MANQTWPSSLPQKPLQEGYEERGPANLLRTQMDKGPPKVRRRTTASPRNFSVQFQLDESQVSTFVDFVDQTLKGGALKFDMEQPRTGTTKEFRIIAGQGEAPYRITNLGGIIYQVSFDLEILP